MQGSCSEAVDGRGRSLVMDDGIGVSAPAWWRRTVVDGVADGDRRGRQRKAAGDEGGRAARRRRRPGRRRAKTRAAGASRGLGRDGGGGGGACHVSAREWAEAAAADASGRVGQCPAGARDF